ncbi:MAG: hypothetical protein LBL72_08520 [Candidatus Accumulibacter sp.]|jgi:hypothetical protein|nr:hypothetical protein [Accumulibacter sp.]
MRFSLQLAETLAKKANDLFKLVLVAGGASAGYALNAFSEGKSFFWGATTLVAWLSCTGGY